MRRLTSPWGYGTPWGNLTSDSTALATGYFSSIYSNGLRALSSSSALKGVASQIVSGQLPSYGFIFEKQNDTTGTAFKFASSRESSSLGPSLGVTWVWPPSLALSAPSQASPVVGDQVSFTATVAGMHDATGTVLTAHVTGGSTQTVTATVHGTTATFSYTSSNPAPDTVVVTGALDGYPVSSNSQTVNWVAPTLSLSAPNPASPFTGDQVSFTATVGRVSNASGTVLTASVLGQNNQTLTATVQGTTATFSYKGQKSGTDQIQVTGTVRGQSLTANTSVTWTALPTLTLSEPSSGTPFVGEEESFSVSVGKVSDATGTVLTATISGANSKQVTATVHGTAANFSYTGSSPGDDSISVFGTISGRQITSNTVSLTWYQVPALTLSGPDPSSPSTGEEATFTLSAENVPDGTNLHPKVTGENAPSIPSVTVDTGTVTFSYRGITPGEDTVKVTGSVYGHAISSNSVSFTWVPGVTPSLNLSRTGSSTLITGDTVHFEVQIVNVDDATGDSLDVSVDGANSPAIDPVTINGKTATFSYSGSQPGKDQVEVSGTIDGFPVSGSISIDWYAPPVLIIHGPSPSSPFTGDTVTFTVSDGGIIDATGETLTATVSGANPQTLTSTFKGQSASFSYSGAKSGTDTIEVTGTICGRSLHAETSVSWIAPPNLTISQPSVSPFTGDSVSFTVTVGNVSDASGTPLSVNVMGTNLRLLETVVSGTTATFSYSGSIPGQDQVQVAGTISGVYVQSNTVSVDWLAPPTITLSRRANFSPFTGDEASFTAAVGNVSDATGSTLTAHITGANPQTLTATVSGKSASFSYEGDDPGADTVQVTGTISGRQVSSYSMLINWLAGANSVEANFGPVYSSISSASSAQFADFSVSAVASLNDPVNSLTGNFFQSAADVSVVGTGVPFSLDRTYNSRDDSVGVLGRGWSGSLWPSLSEDDLGDVTLRSGDGQQIAFQVQPDGSYQGASNVTATLTKTDSGYDLVQKSQVLQHFDSDGRIVSWLDANGQGLSFSYADGLLTQVTDAAGREYGLTYNDGGRLEGVSLPDGTSLSYGYDGDLLTSFTDQTGAETIYVYDGNDLMKSTIDASGKLLFENAYDDEGRVLTQKDASGNESSFDWSEDGKVLATDANDSDWKDVYNDEGQLETRTDALGAESGFVYDDSNDLTSLTDPLGNATQMTYDERGNMLSQTNVLGGSESWTYDEDNNVTSHTDALGNVTTYTYDSSGNMLSETDPLGNTTSYEYDSAGRRTAITDPLGHTTRSVYDDQGNLIEKILPSGAKTTYTYDALGNELSETDPLGNTTTNVYDEAGRLIKTIDPLGNTSTTTYDEAGRTLSSTDANGNTTSYVYDENGRQVKVTNPEGSSTETAYDALGSVISTTDPLGKVTRFEYDADGRQIATISPDGERTETKYDADGNPISSTDALEKSSQSKYDALGRVIESTDPLGRTTQTRYDAAGNVIETIDPLGNVTTQKYDADGRVVETIDPLGHSMKSSYDAAGQVVSETDANGGVTLHSYDADGNEISTTDPSGGVTTSSYDADGRLISSTDPLGRTSTYTYDANGSQISATNPLGATTIDTYDSNGNQIAEIDPLGNVSNTVYDSLNRPIEEIDPLGRKTKTAYDLSGNVASTTDPLGNTTTYSYDAEGRLVMTTDPLGNSTVSTYDKAGQLVSKTDANGHTTTYAYDAVGEKTSVTAPDGSVTSFAYDENGNLVERTDANGHATTYAYDAVGNRTSKTDPLGRTWHYSYDGNGNLTETKTPSGGTISQSYDLSNRLLSKVYSDETPSVSFSYDEAGQKVSATDGTGTTYYSYDAAGELLSASGPSGMFSYTYDATGNLTSRTYPTGLRTSYSYDAASEMTSASVKGEKTLYAYDANGKLTSTLHPNGILDTRSYDEAGRIAEIAGVDERGKPLYSRSYTYDPAGNPVTLEASAPRDHSPGWWGSIWRYKGSNLTKWQETYSYDSQDRLTEACMNESCSRFFSYSYDPVGNRTELETRKSTTTYSYDEADELLSSSKLKKDHHHPDVTDYAYDENGNQVKAGSTRYSYDLENDLIKVEGKHDRDRVSYTYAEDGLMQTRSTRSETTTYAWDRSTEIPNLATETLGKGRKVSTTSYTYGQGLLDQIDGRDTRTFHLDAIGSVIELSNDRGKVEGSYRYTPFGQTYASDADGGDSDNPIRFAGQYLDSETDLYDMRARQYDPETGRFLEEDPLACDEACSSTYVYAENNPILLIDPSGEGAMYAVDGGQFYGAGYLDSEAFFSSYSLSRRPPKTVRVTFYSSGKFTTPFKIDPRARWTAEKVSGGKGWRICGYKSGCEKHRNANGVMVEYAGPAWAYDEASSTHSASSEKKSIKHAAKYARGDNSIKGYVYVAHGGGWHYTKPAGVHITRSYIEMYDSGNANPRKYWSGLKVGTPTVAVRESDRRYNPRPRDAASYVYDVCKHGVTSHKKWMGIWASAGPTKIDPITGKKVGGLDLEPEKIALIYRALDRCSLHQAKNW
jgi:RHS repeat-associated protein